MYPCATHTSAYASIRQHTPAYVSTRQHTSAHVSTRQHTSAYALGTAGRCSSKASKVSTQVPKGPSMWPYPAAPKVSICTGVLVVLK